MARTETRRARRRDLAAIEETFGAGEALGEREHARACLEELIDGSGGDLVLVSVREERVVGVVGLTADWCEAQDVFWLVKPRVAGDRHQGLRLGRLLSRAAEEARRCGGRKLYLDTSSNALRDEERRVYEELGFAVEATLRDYHGAGDDQLIFGLRLT